VPVPERDPGVLETLEASLALDEEGRVTGTMTLTARGSLAGLLRQLLAEVPEERLDAASGSFATRSFPGAKVVATNLAGMEDDAEELVIRVGLMDGSWGRPTATGLALPRVTGALAIFSEYASLAARRFPLLVDAQELREDRLRVTLPAGLALHDPPPALALRSDFGRYELDARLDDEGALVLERRAHIGPQRVEPERYDDFRRFARAIHEAESQEITLRIESPSLRSAE
jgi:hypothetical protein